MGCYNHSREAEKVQQHTNTTQVDGCFCGDGDHDPVDPCSREESILCQGANPNCEITPDPECSEQKCGPWEEADLPDGDEETPQAPHNTFEEAETHQASPCRKLGFKNVQAKKAYHGAPPFTAFSGESGTAYDCSCRYRGEQITVPYDRKYLCMEASASGYSDVYCSFPEATRHTDEGSMDGTACVDSHSGFITYECDASPVVFYSGAYDYPTQVETLFNYVQGLNTAALIDRYCSWLSTVEMDYLTTADCNSIAWYHDYGGGVIKSGSITVSATSMHYAQHQENGTGGTWDETEDITISDTDATYDYQLSDLLSANTVEEDCAQSLLVYHAEAHLSEEYTAEDWQTDLYDLASQWDLADDAVYPWRIDGYVTVAPLVSYDETPTAPIALGPTNLAAYVTWLQDGSPGDPVELECPADTTDGKTGAMRGAPLPAGYLGAWDFFHITWAACDDCETPVSWPNRRAYGAKSSVTSAGDITDSFVPGTATQWTDNFEASKMVGMFNNDTGVGGGAFVEYGSVYPGWGYMQKWAEIQVNRPGINFERPCGDADRRALDESTVRCITAYDPETGLLTFAPAYSGSMDRAGIFGWDGLADGFYNTTQIDDTHIQLAGDFVEGTYDGDAGSGIIGHKRWEDDAVPDCPDPSTLTCNGRKGRGDFYFVQWTHDFRDYQERDTWIAACAAEMPEGCGCIDCPSEQIRQYQASWGMPRSVSSFDYQAGNLPFDKCWPQVMAITPHGETWSNGTNYDFPAAGDVVPDDTYGSLWQACVVQTMPDPFWKAPHKPCVSCEVDGDPVYGPTSCRWIEDEGQCLDDDESCDCLEGDGYIAGAKYYPQRRWVEGRFDNLDGCPTLPENININLLTLDNLSSADPPPSGKVLAPPAVVEANFAYAGPCPYFDVVIPPVSQVMPWVIWLDEVSCVCGSESTHRFISEYRANGVDASC